MQKPVFGIVLMLAMLVSTPIFSQKKEIKAKFGKISDEEISMKNYAPDPNAAAVILFDKSVVLNEFATVYFAQTYMRHTRIKIFNKNSYSLANRIIEYYKDERFIRFNVSSFNVENGVLVETKLAKDQIFDEKLGKYQLIRKFAIPSVREGSIIDIEYTIEKPGANYIPDWYFQHEEYPTIWSEYFVTNPDFLKFKKLATGWSPFTVAEEEEVQIDMSDHKLKRKGLHYVVENAPGLKPEPMVISAQEYLTKIKFDISSIEYRGGYIKKFNTTWQTLADEFLKEWLDEALDSGKSVSEEAENLTQGISEKSMKLAAIYAYIGKNFQSNKLNYVYNTQSFKSLMTSHKGSVTDLNLLFICMLRKAKVNAWPVMISTQQQGMIIKWNVSQFAFNRIITAVESNDNQITLIDASAWPTPIGLLPLEDLNGEGLMIKEKQFADWIPLVNKISNREAIVSDLNLTADGHLKGNLTFSESGYQATDFREKLAASNEKAVVSEKFKDLIGDGKLTENKLENAENPLETSLKGSFLLETKSFVTSSGGKIYLQPALGLGDREQPFKAAERKFNIDLGTPSDLNLNFTYSIPAGYKVEEMPKSAKIVFGENAMTFEYLTEIKDDKMKLSVRKKVKKTYFEAAEYADMKQFYSAILAKMGEQVVLTKI